MGSVWVIENPALKDEMIATALMGNFPVRLIASMGSMQKILQMKKTCHPGVVVVNLLMAEFDFGHAENIFNYYMPNTNRIYINGTEKLMGASGKATVFARKMDDLQISQLIKRVMKTSETTKSDCLRFKDIELDYSKLEMFLKPLGVTIALSHKESLILKILIEKAGKCLSRQQIQQDVWSGTAVSLRTIDSHISRLRKRMVDTELSIDSVYGGGYVLR